MHNPSIEHSPSVGERPSLARRSARRFALGLGLIALIGAAAYGATRPLANLPTGFEATARSPFATGAAVEGIGIGQAAPDFVSAADRSPTLLDLDGRPVRLHDFAGRPVWIIFWTTWCIPCQQEASDVLRLYHAYRGADLAVVAIDVQEPAAAVREFARSHDLDYTIGLDPTAVIKSSYGAVGLPSHYFLDRTGVIRDRYFGQLTGALMEQHLHAIVGS
jgi:cytochrome c biogenesis protein CcmG, thiol:disulfide interchange protein DsbE